MQKRLTNWRRWGLRVALVAATSAVLVTGVAWHGLAAAPASQTVTATAPAISARTGMRESYADVVSVVAPAVVTVRVEARPRVRPTQFGPRDDFFRRFFGDPEDSPFQMPSPRRSGLGSGVVVSDDGYIITNHHVIDEAESITVEFSDGRSFDATLVGSDEPTDVAVLKVDAKQLPVLTLGNSDDVRIGDVVLAVGNPLGIGQTVTMGIISAKGRYTAGASDGSYEDFLQTDAPINQGNSGGALVNTKGELIGINSQIVSTSGGNIGIGFAIPANMAHHVMDEIRTEGHVRRSQLGVTVQQVTSDMAESLGLRDVAGAIVSNVASGSAAEKAGIRQADVIRSFNGEPVRDFNSLRNRVAAMEPGSQATVGIIRDGRDQTLTVKLDEAASSRSTDGETQGSADQASLGVAVTPLTAELASRFEIDRNVSGLFVQSVQPGSRADQAGIREGDVIESVNRLAVQSVDALRAAVDQAADRPLLLLVHREGHDQFVTVRAQ